MDALIKAQLIKEIHDLTYKLEHRSLSLYETAISKKRIHDIFACCDEPIFQKQILEYKALTQPEVAAQTFAAQTPFALSFRGYFLEHEMLENALYAQADTGWAFMHDENLGWQIWLIPAPSRTALISEWGDFCACYDWLLEQQQIYRCLVTDNEISSFAVPLRIEQQTLKHDRLIEQQNELELRSTQPAILIKDEIETQYNLANENVAEQLQIHIAKENPHIDEQTDFENLALTTSAHTTQTFPEFIHIGALHAQLIPSVHDDLNTQQVFALDVSSQHELETYIDFVLHFSEFHSWEACPCYIAEQLDKQSQFIKYLVLLGAENQMEAIRLASLFAEQNSHSIASLKVISNTELDIFINQPEQLYQHYQNAELLWNKDHYFPFIPAAYIHTQKFLHFDEMDADFETPVLLLQERNKIRLIHGEKRMALSQVEHAYPYLLLNRQQGINWQTIQHVIQQLTPPIQVKQLYTALTAHIQE